MPESSAGARPNDSNIFRRSSRVMRCTTPMSTLDASPVISLPAIFK